jgi:hypothetical protein
MYVYVYVYMYVGVCFLLLVASELCVLLSQVNNHITS